MSETMKSEVLQHLVDKYTKRLGGRFAPRLRLVPGPECSYNPITHRIHIGMDVIMQTEGSTWKAIIAHEVGHSQQLELRLTRWLTWGLLTLCLLISSIPTVTRLLGIEGFTSNWTVLAAGLPWLPVLHAKLKGRSEEDRMRLEYDADARAVELVGKETACNALIEYTRVFSGGDLGHEGALRLARMRCLDFSEDSASPAIAV